MTDQNNHSEKTTPPVVKKIGPPQDVPVFSCIAYLSRSASDGQVSCRCANLEGLLVLAATERDALQSIVRAFKEKIAQCEASGLPLPWIDPPLQTDQNETTRYLAVHL